MAISITEALDIIYGNITPLTTEIIPIEMAVGRVMAKDSVATFDLPRFDNSAMDGYAVKCIDADSTVSSDEVIYAGDNPQMILVAKKAIKIMTGAPIPEGCEAIIPIENVSVEGDQVTLPSSIEKDAHIRRSGEDVKSGEVYLKKGERVTAYSIALLASQGVTHLTVYHKIKVAVFGTGDELRPHFEKIELHQLYNSNTPMFLARAKELGCGVRYVPSSGDTIESLEPTAFGKIGDTVIINLPGNPLASMVNYEIFIRAVIHKMSGANAYFHATIETEMREDFTLRKGKYTVRLGTYNGKTFMPLKQQLPGMVSPMQKADGMIITTPDIGLLKKGMKVKMIPILWELNGCEKEDFFTN
ncbi:MAG: molybdopterin molybdenumtransferase MoeA [Epsilonproteobacteria bacterium 4484_65]|nr:MAG: molybdopterin molybdenumtransferase MoeA [Epsilonproteobacteria bacterium 4484_65]